MSRPSPLPAEIQEAKRRPNGWLYRIAPHFSPTDKIPPEAVIGAWKVDATGSIVGEFLSNDKYDPIKWPSKIDA